MKNCSFHPSIKTKKLKTEIKKQENLIGENTSCKIEDRLLYLGEQSKLQKEQKRK